MVQTAAPLGQAGRLQILVQDDASPGVDATKVIGPPADVARNPANLGFAGNCNAGAARAQGDILLFLNQDTIVRPGWAEPILSAFADPAVGIVGPKLVTPAPDGDKIQSCGGLFDGGRGPFHRYLGWAADDWRANIAEPVAWTTGAALAIRRAAFEAVGGFDPGYVRGYFEDVDLCMAVRARGYQIWYTPAAVIEHTVGSTGGVPAEIFRANAARFHRAWDASITPDTQALVVGY